MTRSEQTGEVDPRLANPDQYFGEKYHDVVVNYGGQELTVGMALEAEYKVRRPENIENDSKEKRANILIGLLKAAEALDPVDDVTYEEQ